MQQAVETRQGSKERETDTHGDLFLKLQQPGTGVSSVLTIYASRAVGSIISMRQDREHRAASRESEQV